MHDNHEDVVVAYGTSKSEICMFSLAEGKVVGTLRGGHDRDVRDFKFLPADNLEAWSIGGDGKLIQWNLETDQATRTIALTDSSIQTLSSPSRSLPQILCASGTPYAINLESKDDFRIDSFDAFKHPVHTLVRSSSSKTGDQDLFLAADDHRGLHLYDISKNKIVRTLNSAGDVERFEVSQPVAAEDQILVAVTRDGNVEIFSKPFSIPQAVNGDMKAQRKLLTRRADASLKLVSADPAKKHVPVYAAFFDGPNIILASVEGGVEPVFQKVRWQDEGSGELLFDGVKEVQRAKTASTLNSATMSGAKDMGRTHVNEARTVVVNGMAEPGSQAAPMEIESDAGEEEQSEDEQETAKDNDLDAVSADESDEEMLDAGDESVAADEEAGEPSFGDLLAARHPETISIMDALPTDKNALVQLPESRGAMLPSGMSLGTVLTQSLRTNDQSLLETCLHVTDEKIIQNTILRLDSSLAANLLTKLAERLADRPGRYGHLLTWVQSAMIAHGGAIASQAGVASKLRTLYQVLNERSKILPSILLLRGKLDMMAAQQNFRAQATAHRRGTEDAPGTIYIEGGEDNWSSDEDVDVRTQSKSKRGASRGKKDLNDLVAGAESSDDDDMPLVNGDYHTDEDEEDGSDQDGLHINQPNGIMDDEAEVSGEGTGESGSDETEEDDDDEEDSEMDDFINDGEVSEVEDEDDILDDEPERPAKKKSKNG